MEKTSPGQSRNGFLDVGEKPKRVGVNCYWAGSGEVEVFQRKADFESALLGLRRNHLTLTQGEA